MTFDEFQKSETEPAGVSLPLLALWYDAHGDWEKAHQTVQDDSSSDAAWVHAYLHRKEGDVGNGRYWYSRAGRPEFSGSLAEEWAALAKALLPA